ncbi:DUF4238 domain-containing protein [Paenisporosarcina macmurdoensis]|uniref:DUF4238 domain-containing protein n=1 Tax=Paenisporosarcina macmurdoensis TaxID=212659 RepID=A0ABW1L9V5_9BACL
MVQFDPSWVSNSSKQHLVPNTYLKAWSDNNVDVYYIDKNESKIDFSKEEFQRKTRRLTTIKEFYSRNIYSEFFENNDLEEIFKPLTSQKYSVVFEKEKIESVKKLRELFHQFNEWSIYDSNQILISEEQKQVLKEDIKKVRIRNIEEAWNQMFEDKWPTTRDAILQAVQANLGAERISAVKREELIRFMVAIEWRTYPPQQTLLKTFDELASLEFLSFLHEHVEEEEEKYLPMYSTHGEYFLHNITLKYFLAYFQNKGPMYDEYITMFNNMDIELLIPEAGFEFITSDNPVRMFTNSNNELEYIFPITPVLACAIRKNSRNQDVSKYWITTYPKEKVFIYNDNIRKSCYKGYVLKQPDLKVYFK